MLQVWVQHHGMDFVCVSERAFIIAWFIEAFNQVEYADQTLH